MSVKSRVHKKNSIAGKLILPMILVLVFQSALFIASLFLGGTTQSLESDAAGMFEQRVSNRKNYLQNEMVSRWSNIDRYKSLIEKSIETYMQSEGLDYDDFSRVEATTPVLKSLDADLIEMLRSTGSTGAFIVLYNGDDSTAGTVEMPGLYLRDYDPLYNPEDDSDLLIEKGASSIVKGLGIPMDIQWSYLVKLSPDNSEYASDYFYKPFRAAQEHGDIDYRDLGYWSTCFRLDEDDIDIITYSVPLARENGEPYGVLGIEVAVSYLQKLMPYDELIGDKEGAYILGVSGEGGGSYSCEAVSGPMANKAISGGVISLGEKKMLYSVDSAKDGDYLAAVSELSLYNPNTPFENERWALLGTVSQKYLFMDKTNIMTTIYLGIGISLTVGVLGIYLAGIIFTRPIHQLAKKVREIDPEQPVLLEKTNIAEIDELSSAIEYISGGVAEYAAKMSKIIDLVNMPIGAFEHVDGADKVYCTDSLYSVIGIENVGNYLQYDRFKKMLEYLERSSGDSGICEITDAAGQPRWVRVTTARYGNKTLGVIIDVTSDELEKAKMEYERDYDLMTRLFNRRAFQRKAEALFSDRNKLKVGAFIMWDLDNLKYVNDTYGHDMGDVYLQEFSKVLRLFIGYRSLVARMAGDEFYVFIHGYDSKDEIREVAEEVRQKMLNTVLTLPDGETLRMRASAGLSWYPDDADSVEKLIKYADFAMYEVKNTIKGNLREFDRQSYEKDAFMLQNNEELNKLIEGQLVDFYFQPIVSVKDGSVYGYEALMRPRSASFKSPMDVIRIARSQSKLYQIEHLTFFNAMSTFVWNKRKFGDVKIFINSIPNQALSDNDLEMFEKSFAGYLDRIVVEIIETEQSGTQITDNKRNVVNRWGAALAIDDFGSGYNSELILLKLTPSFVKIDMSIIRGIDTDTDRQKMLYNLISYSSERNIAVIAEGVETVGEFKCVKSMGVDYVQGYFVGRPKLDPRPVPEDILKIIRE